MCWPPLFPAGSAVRTRPCSLLGAYLRLGLTLLVTSGTLATAQSPDAASATPQRPNVLLIAVDDLRPELGCYGASHVDSPHLDRLAAGGVRFDHHYVQVATCGASRYAMLTGRSPFRSGVTRSNSAFYQGSSKLDPQRLPGAQSMPELFRRNGYHTCQIGKISHTADGRVFAYDGSGDGRQEMPHAWDTLATPLGPWERGWGAFFAYADGVSREDGSGHQDLMEFVAEEDEGLPDGLNAKVAVEKLHQYRDQDQPFFLAVGFYKPHLPFVAPRQDWEAMQQREIPPIADRAKPASPHWHRSGEFYRYDFPFPKTRPLSASSAEQARRAYAACVRYTDRQVGRVLAALEATGQADNTIVVVWGDHGWHLGEQQIWAKHTPWNRALRSVLIVRTPAMAGRGSVYEAPVETLDLYPTLVDLCQLPDRQTAFPLDGDSLRAALAAPPAGDRSADPHPPAISFWGNVVTATDGVFRLVCQRDGKANDRLKTIALYHNAPRPDGASMQDVQSQHPERVERLRQAIAAEQRQRS